MNRAPSPHPSSPVGERVPVGRVRGWRVGSRLRCAIRQSWRLPKKGTTHFYWLLLGGLVGAAILFHFPPDEYRFYPRCLLYTLTGLQCPGCGGLRAAHHLLHGEFASAFQLNPLLISLLPGVALILLACVLKRTTGRDWLHSIRWPFWLWLLLAVVVAFAIARNLPPGSLAHFGF